MYRSSPLRSTLTRVTLGLGMCKACTEAVHCVALWTRVPLGLGMCKACTEAVHCVALWTRVTLGLGMCKACTEAVHCVALWTRVTLGLGMCKVCTEAVHCVRAYVPKQSIAYLSTLWCPKVATVPGHEGTWHQKQQGVLRVFSNDLWSFQTKTTLQESNIAIRNPPFEDVQYLLLKKARRFRKKEKNTFTCSSSKHPGICIFRRYHPKKEKYGSFGIPLGWRFYPTTSTKQQKSGVFGGTQKIADSKGESYFQAIISQAFLLIFDRCISFPWSWFFLQNTKIPPCHGPYKTSGFAVF